MILQDYINQLKRYTSEIPYLFLRRNDKKLWLEKRIWEGEWNEIPEKYKGMEVDSIDFWIKGEIFTTARPAIEIGIKVK